MSLRGIVGVISEIISNAFVLDVFCGIATASGLYIFQAI